MSAIVLRRLRTGFLLSSPVPVVVWGVSWAYVIWTDRWGAFAAAPFLVASNLLSGGLGLLGLFLLLWQGWQRNLDLILAAATLLASSVFIYESQY